MPSRGVSTGAASRTFDLEPLGDYSLRESAGFIDAWHEAPSEGDQVEGHLHLAFLSDGAWVPAGVWLTPDAAGRVGGGAFGTGARAGDAARHAPHLWRRARGRG